MLSSRTDGWGDKEDKGPVAGRRSGRCRDRSICDEGGMLCYGRG